MKPIRSILRKLWNKSKRFRIPTRYFIFLLCALIIVVRVLWGNIRFDQTSLWIFIIAVIVILIPDIGDLVARIRKVKKGDFEIEFESRIAQLALNTEKAEEEAQETEIGEYLSEYSPLELRGRISEITRDPRAGLVALAAEIEAALSILAERYNLRGKGKRIPNRYIITELARRGVVPKDLPVLFNDFWSIRNQAVHSITFQPSDQSLYEILDLGTRILRLLSIVQSQENQEETSE